MMVPKGMGVTLCIFVLSYFISSSTGVNIEKLKEAVTEATEEEALGKWKDIENLMQDGMDSLIKMVLPTLLRSSSDVELSGECMTDILRIVFDLRKFKLWAIKLLDASGKPEGGNLMGTLSALGSYKECINIEFPLRDDGDPETVGQYCMIDLALPLPPLKKRLRLGDSIFTIPNATFKTEPMELIKGLAPTMYIGGFRIGVCVPSTCTIQDLTDVLSSALKTYHLNTNVYSCEKKEPLVFDQLQLAIASILVLIVLLNVFATLTDCFIVHFKFGDYEAKSPSFPVKMIRAWSLKRNVADTMKLREKSSSNTLTAVHGLRVITLSWIIIGHTLFQIDPYILRGAIGFGKTFESWTFQVFMNAHYAVQTFFLISSLLMAYLTVKYIDAHDSDISKLPWGVVKRIWRLLPTIALVIGIVILIPLVGSGPLWNDTTSMFSDSCRKTWWNYFIFMNNYVGVKQQMCMPHLWFIAVDFQLFIVAVFYIVLLYKKPVLAKFFLWALGVSGILITGLVSFHFGFPAVIDYQIVDIDYFFKYIEYINIMIYTNCGVYAIGLALGTFLARNNEVRLPKLAWIAGWVIATASALALIYGPHKWIHEKSNIYETLIYGSTGRTAWTACVAWLIFACSMGKGGFVNSILSWRGFAPFVQINYAMYVIHVVVINAFIASLQGPIDTTPMIVVWVFFGNFGISILSGFAIKVLFESPLNNMYSIIIIPMVLNKRDEKKDDDLPTVKIMFNKKQEVSEPELNGKYTSRM